MDRTAALEWIAAARTARHELRDELAAGKRDLVEVLSSGRHDPLTGSVKLLWTLESIPGARKIDTRRMLATMGLAENLRLCDLDDGEVERILDRFPLEAAS